MYNIRNGDDESEPRITPKPTTKLDCFLVPTVPEVSLIFDKPFKESLQAKRTSMPILKSTEYKSKGENNGLLAQPHTNDTYTAWKEQNQFWKSAFANTDKVLPYVQHTLNNSIQPPSGKTLDVSQEHKESQYGSRDFNDGRTKFQNREGYGQVSNNRRNAAHYRQEKDDMKAQENAKSNSKVEPIFDEHTRRLDSDLVRQMPLHVSNNQPHIIHRSDYPPSPHIAHPYPYLDSHGYPFPPFYPPPMNTHNVDSQETVKNLLQLVNNQSEQIRSLQLQLDRLLKMQEECFKERQRCTCQGLQQKGQSEFYPESYDNTSLHNNQTIAKSQNQNICPQDHTKNIMHENAKAKQLDSAGSDFQTKKAFMEQKVSIGVMTSFEFTVQNNPFTVDSETHERPEMHTTSDGIKRCSAMNVCDTNEALRRYKNSFSRMPPGQLENIVEDSESYLSSSQQQSSNINSSASLRDIEKPVYMNVQKEPQYSESDSPRQFSSASMLTNNEVKIQTDFGANCNGKMNAQDKRNSVSQNVIPVSNLKQNVIGKKSNLNKPMELNRDGYNIPKAVKDTPTISRNKQQRIQCPTSTTNIHMEDSLVFSGCDLNVNDRPPSPEPSIHVEMNEYSSDDESEKVKRTSKVGWTFYNNVLGQVNQILQNTSVTDENDYNRVKGDNKGDENDTGNSAAADAVKVATLEQLRKLGISLNDNMDSGEINGNRMIYDSTFYPRLDPQANVTHTTSAVNETNTSMHMKALAMKYLSDDQLAELAIQRQGSTSLKQLMLSNMQGTNMSFATMRYLERYQLLPGKTNNAYEESVKPSTDISGTAEQKFVNQKKPPALRFPFNQTPRTSCPSKILDISTLKQQPKLL